MNISRQYSSSTQRIEQQAKVSAGEIALDSDTGNTYLRTTTGWQQIAAGGTPQVFGADQIPGQIVEHEFINITNTIQFVSYPSGALAIEFEFVSGSESGTTASVARAVYVVFNATSLADATGKLALKGARRRIKLDGRPWGRIASPDTPITNAYFVAEAADPTGHTTLNISARIPS